MSNGVERAFVRRLNRRARSLSPELRRLELRAYALVKRTLNERELIEAIRAGWVDAFIDRVLGDRNVDPMFQELRSAIDQGVLNAGQLSMNDLPSSARGTLDILNPQVVAAAQALDTEVIDGILKPDMRQAFRQHVAAGLREGVAPQTIARGARDMIGLAPNMEEAVRNFEKMLESGDLTALSRELRDKRFDPTLRKALGEGGAGLSRTQINKMTEAYRRKYLAWNANTHARTAAVDAQKAGQRLAWEDAARNDRVERGSLKREWVTVGDSRVRPSHQLMNGEVVGFDERFSNGEMTPGESTYNCRCYARTFVSRDRAAA